MGEPDFSGYATKAGLKCSDGRTIMPDAFKHQNRQRVPLVWRHGHGDIKNVLGHVDLVSKADGMYCYAFFNNTESGKIGKETVAHGDIRSLSIFANELIERGKNVFHGMIKEVSLVMSGANPGATIDFVRLEHGDDSFTDLTDSAVITMDLPIEHEDLPEGFVSLADEPDDSSILHDGPVTVDRGTDANELTIQDVWDAMSPEEQAVCQFMVDQALESAGTGADLSQSDKGSGPNGELTSQDVYDRMNDDQKFVVHGMLDDAIEATKKNTTDELTALMHQEGNTMGHNVFEGGNTAVLERPTLSHDQMETVIADMEKYGKFSESLLAHADEYGIENIELMFPDALVDQNGISVISRRMEWVQNVLSGTKHSPFSRVKSLTMDITAEEARARGYVKGSMKKTEIVKLLSRITTAKTIYKKQKLDRDDILDITSLDVVSWLKAEMRVMLDEELARAILVGDGRDPEDPDKIDEEHIRPIAYDNDMYTTKVSLDANIDPLDLVDSVVRAMVNYKGTGVPTLYTTQKWLTAMLLVKDGVKRRLYPNKAELAAALMVADVIPVEAMEQNTDLIGVIVNLVDYQVGADKGGEVNMFENFDIDFNQERYLIETRVSGALIKPKSAVALVVEAADQITPSAPTFVNDTGILTIPNQPNVVYLNADTNTQLAPGAQPAIGKGASVDIQARPAAGFAFTHDATDEWEFTRPVN